MHCVAICRVKSHRDLDSMCPSKVLGGGLNDEAVLAVDPGSPRQSKHSSYALADFDIISSERPEPPRLSCRIRTVDTSTAGT